MENFWNVSAAFYLLRLDQKSTKFGFVHVSIQTNYRYIYPISKSSFGKMKNSLHVFTMQSKDDKQIFPIKHNLKGQKRLEDQIRLNQLLHSTNMQHCRKQKHIPVPQLNGKENEKKLIPPLVVCLQLFNLNMKISFNDISFSKKYFLINISH